MTESSNKGATTVPKSDFSLSQHTPAHRVTSVLLNGKFFAAWSRSFQLFFGSRWDELAQYEPLSEFPIEVASIVVKQQSRQHTYQFLMDLKSEFDPLRIHILNTSPMPSLYEPFATIDGEE
ncbi:hypothetical protein RHGRI_007420 [Rhododendron griersonianum]|uniref:Uncharacterized protein n=1 Tax=Rhododendron griersonianum TaxID=479676 RepID=A0AAV6KZQ4_9ERIC|nr:hypothetical protein RHGRI_007420 [Rhododendron griersonianum]